ncbi:MAG: exodeoxyribonuclease III [Myxococcota bacterium]|nr:exodeoxyribonuclease III [Myxococcota bacterium]
MKIISWNVNSIRARYDRFLNYLQTHEPDVVCVQELKCTEADFPFDEVSSLGYMASVHGQKSYNGVAILSFEDQAEISCGFDDEVEDSQARLIAATIGGVRVVNVYVPNGGELESDKWVYKLRWYERLHGWLARHHSPSDDLILCGDFNVTPSDIDVARPQEWGGGVLCDARARAQLTRLTTWGLFDTFRERHPDAVEYSWWDYRRNGFYNGNGLRIDMIYATSSLLAQCGSASIDRDERAGEKPSDHAPVVATFQR